MSSFSLAKLHSVSCAGQVFDTAGYASQGFTLSEALSEIEREHFDKLSGRTIEHLSNLNASHGFTLGEALTEIPAKHGTSTSSVPGALNLEREAIEP